MAADAHPPEASGRPYHYVIVRTDLPVEHQLAQAVHAGYEAGSRFGTYDRNGNLVVCQVSGVTALRKAIDYLLIRDVPAILWREGDLGNEPTAIGTAPLGPELRKHMRKFKLWRPPR